LAFRGFYSIPDHLESASQLLTQVKLYIDTHKDVETYIYSSYYKLAFTFYASKRKYKQFYTSALQYLAYTQSQEIEENEKLSLLFQMAIAVLLSEEIYNFSELLEQPLLVSLKNSSYAWMYELIEVFNRGDIARFNAVTLDHVKISLPRMNSRITENH
jgi:26S proteasome regulatory subunit N9